MQFSAALPECAGDAPSEQILAHRYCSITTHQARWLRLISLPLPCGHARGHQFGIRTLLAGFALSQNTRSRASPHLTAASNFLVLLHVNAKAHCFMHQQNSLSDQGRFGPHPLMQLIASANGEASDMLKKATCMSPGTEGGLYQKRPYDDGFGFRLSCLTDQLASQRR